MNGERLENDKELEDGDDDKEKPAKRRKSAPSEKHQEQKDGEGPIQEADDAEANEEEENAVRDSTADLEAEAKQPETGNGLSGGADNAKLADMPNEFSDSEDDATAAEITEANEKKEPATAAEGNKDEETKEQDPQDTTDKPESLDSSADTATPKTPLVSASTTFKGGFGSFVKSGFASSSSTPRANIFGSSSSSTPTSLSATAGAKNGDASPAAGQGTPTSFFKGSGFRASAAGAGSSFFKSGATAGISGTPGASGLGSAFGTPRKENWWAEDQDTPKVSPLYLPLRMAYRLWSFI